MNRSKSVNTRRFIAKKMSEDSIIEKFSTKYQTSRNLFNHVRLKKAVHMVSSKDISEEIKQQFILEAQKHLHFQTGPRFKNGKIIKYSLLGKIKQYN